MTFEIRATRTLTRNLIVALAYALIGLIALRFVQDTGVASPVWPSAGIAFAAVFQWGPRLLPGVFVGSIVVNVTSLWLGGNPWPTVLAVAVVMATGASAQAWIGATLVRRVLGPRPSLTRARQVLLFMLLGGLVACLLNPTVGVAAQLLVGYVKPGEALMVWVTWWVGDAIGVIVFAPLVFMLFAEQHDVWEGRRLKVAIPSLLVLFMAIGAYVQYSSLAHRQEATALAAAAEEVTHDLQRSVSMSTESLEGIKSLFESQSHVSPKQFRAYTYDMLHDESGLLAVSWNPVVPEGELQAFTVRERATLSNPAFEVFERDADGLRIPVESRPFYVPVTYIEPLATNQAAVGFDIESNPCRADAVHRASATGRMALTAPVQLVQETSTQNGVLMLLPLYGEEHTMDETSMGTNPPTAFAVGVYRMQDLMRATFANTHWNSADITLTDVTPGATPAPLATLGAGTAQAGQSEVGVQDLSVGGRVWQVAVVPPADVTSLGGLLTAPLFLIGGLLISVLLEAFLLLMTGVEKQARRLAAETSHGALHDPLTDLPNRRAFLAALEQTRQAVTDSGSSAVLMYLDLDGFKLVNDRAGHEAGDEMLRGIARIFRDRVRAGDLVARIGGDEFAFILANCSSARGVDVATSLVGDVESFVLERPQGRFTVSASVGVLEFAGADVEAIEDLLHRADRACYEAKRAGAGRIRLATPFGMDWR